VHVGVAGQLRRVQHAVLVVVLVRATVDVLELVEVLGVVRAGVDAVEDRVAVVVRIRAAVLVLELVDVFLLVAAVDVAPVVELVVVVDPHVRVVGVALELRRVEHEVAVVVLVGQPSSSSKLSKSSGSSGHLSALSS
jgi:uncharacterized membrane protein YgcG